MRAITAVFMFALVVPSFALAANEARRDLDLAKKAAPDPEHGAEERHHTAEIAEVDGWNLDIAEPPRRPLAERDIADAAAQLRPGVPGQTAADHHHVAADEGAGSEVRIPADDHQIVADAPFDPGRPADDDHGVGDFFVGRHRDASPDGDAGFDRAIDLRLFGERRTDWSGRLLRVRRRRNQQQQ